MLAAFKPGSLLNGVNNDITVYKNKKKKNQYFKTYLSVICVPTARQPGDGSDVILLLHLGSRVDLRTTVKVRDATSCPGGCNVTVHPNIKPVSWMNVYLIVLFRLSPISSSSFRLLSLQFGPFLLKSPAF